MSDKRENRIWTDAGKASDFILSGFIYFKGFILKALSF